MSIATSPHVRSAASELFTRFVRESSDAIAISRLSDGRLLEVNDAFLDMVGYTREDVIGRTTVELGLWANPGERAAITDAVRGRTSARVEFDLRHRSGAVRHVSASVQIMELDGEPCILAVDRDETRRREAEEERRETEEMLRATIESTADGILVVDERGRTAYANRRFAEMWRIPADILETRSDERLIAFVLDQLLDPGAFRAKVAELYQTDRDSLDVLEFKDGRVFERYSRPLMDAGRVTGRVWSFRDVTERRRAEEQLEQAWRKELEAAQRLRSLDEMKNTFLEAVSHELRTPLTAVLGSALTLEREDLGLQPREVRDLLDRIAANARKLNQLLTDLLDVDRLARGIIEPKRVPVALGELVERVVADTDVGEHPVEIDVPEPLTASLDPAKVERILENLLVNSARHSPHGTPIWVRVRAADAGALLIVEDAGPGVAPELREAVFEPFRQAPGSPAHAHAPGVGIGLSLVARFAELHGGRAWAEEREGGGASFKVLLPDAS